MLDLDLSLGLGEMQGSEDAGHGNPGMLQLTDRAAPYRRRYGPQPGSNAFFVLLVRLLLISHVYELSFILKLFSFSVFHMHI